MNPLRVIPLAAVLALGFGLSAAHAEGDAAAGKKVYNKCKACHVVDSDKNRVGPSLKGIFGRTPGTFGGFKYSKAMVAFGEAGNVWDEATVDAYLEKPKKLVKGTKMAFPGLKKEEDRKNVIAYLKESAM